MSTAMSSFDILLRLGREAGDLTFLQISLPWPSGLRSRACDRPLRGPAFCFPEDGVRRHVAIA